MLKKVLMSLLKHFNNFQIEVLIFPNISYSHVKVFGEQRVCRNVCEYVQNSNTRFLHQWIRASIDYDSKYVRPYSFLSYIQINKWDFNLVGEIHIFILFLVFFFSADFEDMSCEMVYGQVPPPFEEDEVSKQPCFADICMFIILLK